MPVCVCVKREIQTQRDRNRDIDRKVFIYNTNLKRYQTEQLLSCLITLLEVNHFIFKILLLSFPFILTLRMSSRYETELRVRIARACMNVQAHVLTVCARESDRFNGISCFLISF